MLLWAMGTKAKGSQDLTYDTNALERRRALLDDLTSIARTITLPYFHTPTEAANKSNTGYDPVTEADIKTERALRDIIAQIFPNDAISGEEFKNKDGTSGWRWTLDPIDGTRAFIAGVPVWSTLIALEFQEDLLLGLADFPALNTRYLGEPGQSFSITPHGTAEVKCRPCPSLSEAILGCTEPMSMFTLGELAAYNMIRSGVRFTRLGLDSLGYALLAAGRMDIILEADLKACDIRALVPIIENAGGAITDWHGGSPYNGGRVVAVGDKRLLPELYTYLGRAMDN